MKPLLKKEWSYSDFPKEPNKVDGTILHAIRRLYPFAAQQAGYYPAVVMSDFFAKIEYTNLTYYLRNFARIAAEHNIFSYHENVISIISNRLDEYEKMHQLLEEHEKMRHYIAHLESQVKEFYPKTSLKWQLKNRFLKLFQR